MFWKTHSEELKVGSSRTASSSQPAKSKVLGHTASRNEFSHNLSELRLDPSQLSLPMRMQSSQDLDCEPVGSDTEDPAKLFLVS